MKNVFETINLIFLSDPRYNSDFNNSMSASCERLPQIMKITFTESVKAIETVYLHRHYHSTGLTVQANFFHFLPINVLFGPILMKQEYFYLFLQRVYFKDTYKR